MPLLRPAGHLLPLLAVAVVALLVPAAGLPSPAACTPRSTAHLAHQLALLSASRSLLQYHESFYAVGLCMRDEAHLRMRAADAHPPLDLPPGSVCSYYRRGGLCPSRMVATVDRARFPATLLSARCSCKFCVPGNATMTCHGLPYYTHVLRRRDGAGCDADGGETWKASLAVVHLGCVCSRQRDTAWTSTRLR